MRHLAPRVDHGLSLEDIIESERHPGRRRNTATVPPERAGALRPRRRQLAPTGYPGANGVKVHRGAVWLSDLDQGTRLRIPTISHGRVGRIQTTARGLVGIDDFAFTGEGGRCWLP